MKLFFTFFILCISIDGFSQLKLPVKAIMPVKKEVQAVAADFYNQFNACRGEVEFESPSKIIYSSKMGPKDALECVIIRFPDFNTYMWEAKMLQTNEYNEAAKLYENFYKQLQKARVNLGFGTSLALMGEYIAPDERRRFASTVLNVETEEEKYKNFKIEINMSYNFPEWEVALLMYEKVSDADVRPTRGQ